MSVHSYSRCWIHLIWGTLNRQKLLDTQAAARLSRYLNEYADTKGVYMKINFVNADHVHALIDLPTNLSVEELIQLLKGSSSHWVNANNILRENLRGDEATAASLSRDPILNGLLSTCRARRTPSGAHVCRRIARVRRVP
jgi:putative transposase